MDNQRFITEDGSHSLQSSRYGVSYHSRFGAVEETQHVFIEAALLQKLPFNSELKLLGIGFGTGLNAFMTYLESLKHHVSIHYTAIEAFPISLAEALQLNYPEVLNAEEHRSLFHQFHSASWNELIELSDNFTFEKRKITFQEITDNVQYDIIYYDAFAPNAQPELWETDLLKIMFNALKPDGILTTYCAKGQVKRNLKAVGFTIESIPGPPRKREMTRATRPLIS